MKILLKHLATGEFFDGTGFSAARGVAHDFKHSRTALEYIREKNWSGMSIVLAYSDGKMVHVNADSILRPPE